MLNYFNPDFNTQFNDNIKYSDIYRKTLESLDLSGCVCPYCQAVGCFDRETAYARSFINSINEIDNPDTLPIQVFRCSICGHCHAVLPTFICPFSSYSYPFIIHALHEYYCGLYMGNRTKTAAILGISRQLLSNWIKRYEEGAMEIRISVIDEKNRNFDMKQILERIRRTRELLVFLAAFLRINHHMFFTRHNPKGRRFYYGALNTESNKACVP